MAKARNLKKVSKHFWLFAFLFAMAVGGCSLSHDYRSTGGAWHKSDTLLFGHHIDTEVDNLVDVFAGIRYSAAYPYKDLWLQIDVVAGDSLVSRDSICCDIYDENGRRNGTTAGILYQEEYFVSSIEIPYCQPFDIRLTHLMGDTLLQGVYNVGIRLVPRGRHLPSER